MRAIALATFFMILSNYITFVFCRHLTFFFAGKRAEFVLYVGAQSVEKGSNL